MIGDTSTLGAIVTTSGRVYGYSFNDYTQSVVRFHANGVGGQVLRTEPNGYGVVVANDQLVVETYSGTAPALVYLGGQWVDMPSRVTNLGDATLADLYGMNDRGDAVGDCFLPSGDQRGLILLRQD